MSEPHGARPLGPWPFAGFSTRRESAVAVPEELFTCVLAEVQDIAELKVLLTVFRLVAAQREVPPGRPRAVSWEQLAQDEALRQGLSILGQDITPNERLDLALQRAVARGTLLHLLVQRGGHAESWYVINTAANRRLLEELEKEPGALLAGTPLAEASAVRREPPGILALYEQNIGLITPLLAEELEEAGQKYPPDWIEEAFREAVALNRRNWRYIRAILERWEREGRGERPSRGTETLDVEDYTRGKYARLYGKRRSGKGAGDETDRS